MCRLFSSTLALALLLTVPRIADAAASYDNCKAFITSIPAVIASSGTYCVNADVSMANVSGNAITVNADDVVIDCNEFKIGGLAAGAGTLAVGIGATDRHNLTIRHCNIRGFFYGTYIHGSSSGNHLIEDNRFDGNTEVGIEVEGDGSVVRRNRVFNSGGSTLLQDAFGILTLYSVDLLDNTVSGVKALVGGGGTAVGIQTNTDVGGVVIGNGVRGLAKDGVGKDYGIYNVSGTRLNLRRNDVVGNVTTGSVGLYCESTDNRAVDNTITGFATATSTCNDSGGNVVVP